MSTTTTQTGGGNAPRAFWKIQHSSIAAGQNIASPDGEKFFAVYDNPEKISFVYDSNIGRDASNVIPARIRERIRERFSFLFYFPVQERNAIHVAMPVEYINVSRHE